MAEFEMNGRRYRELPDGRVQDIGPAGGQGTYIPPSARTERKKDAKADKAAADAAAAAGAAPYAGPTAAANLNGPTLDNDIPTETSTDTENGRGATRAKVCQYGTNPVVTGY